jgi:hypothetical protein
MSGQASDILATTALPLRKKTKRSRLERSSGHGPGLFVIASLEITLGILEDFPAWRVWLSVGWRTHWK